MLERGRRFVVELSAIQSAASHVERSPELTQASSPPAPVGTVGLAPITRPSTLSAGLQSTTEALTQHSDSALANKLARTGKPSVTATFAGRDAAIHRIGRFDLRGPGGPKSSWSGTGIVARFSGTGIVARMPGVSTYFEATINNGAPRVIKNNADGSPVVLAENLHPGEHTLQLYRRTEGQFGSVELESLTVTDGVLVPSAYPFARTIETVGASMTAGYGADSAITDCGFTPETESSRASFGAFLAQRYGAALATVAWAGRGVVRDAGGGTTEQVPELYERSIATDATSSYQFDQYAPGVIVVNRGTNDFGPGDPGEDFEKGYIAFIEKLRAKNPGAAIIATSGPMATGPMYAERVARAIAALQAKGMERVAFVELTPMNLTDGVGCAGHPNALTHQRMAEQLAPVVRELTGWD